jgi:hypothetical protein
MMKSRLSVGREFCDLLDQMPAIAAKARRALALFNLSMIFSENRYRLFRIML